MEKLPEISLYLSTRLCFKINLCDWEIRILGKYFIYCYQLKITTLSIVSVIHTFLYYLKEAYSVDDLKRISLFGIEIGPCVAAACSQIVILFAARKFLRPFVFQELFKRGYVIRKPLNGTVKHS